MSEVQVVVAGDQKETAEKSVAKQPIITIDSRLQQMEAKSQAFLIAKNEKGAWNNQGSVYYEGTVARIKSGQDMSYQKVDPSDKEGATKVVKAYLQAKLLRAFGWREVKGARIPRIDIMINGSVSGRWSIPKPEEAETAEAYVLRNGETLRKLRDTMISSIFQNSQDDIVFQTCLDME